MGSPITHLYQHYFPDRYPPFYKPTCAQDGIKRESDWDDAEWPWRELVGKWINVGRSNDFVGTVIDDDKAFHYDKCEFPKNEILLRGGGHVNYWAEDDVLDKIQSV